MGHFGNAGIYLIQTLFSLYIFVVMLRFLLQLSRADFYNPITQFVVRATNPLVRPLQSLIRPMGSLDLATLLLGLVLKAAALILILQLAGLGVPALSILLGALTGVVASILNIYFFAVIISIILSWVAPHSHHPGAILLHQLTEPVMAPVRKLIPPIGGLDLSPIFLFIGINLLEILIVAPLAQMSGLPARLVMGI